MVVSDRYCGSLLVLLGLLIVPPSSVTRAASPEAGLPPLQVFTHEDYGAARQNWALTQDDRGIVYVGNVDGVVLSFDGVRWRSTPVPNSATVRSLATGPAGRVYVGTVGNFGYLKPDPQGRHQFVSLLDRLPPDQRDFTDVWDIFVDDEAVYFFTFNGLYRIADETVRHWAPEERFHLSFQVGERIFVREVGHGLKELIDDQLQLVSGGERFSDERIYAMLPWGHAKGFSKEAVLIGTREDGWYVHDKTGLERWQSEIDQFLPEDLLYQAILLDDGRLAVATLRGGVSLLTPDGRLERRITRNEGLPDNAVFRLYQDSLGGLWLALNSGIVRLNTNSSISHFDRGIGLSGQVVGIERYQGRIFAATTDGLYAMVTGIDGAARFSAIDEIRGQAWRLLALEDSLLVSTMEGVYQWRKDDVELVRPSAQTSFALLRSRTDPNRVWVSLHTGLAAMYRDGQGGWTDEGRLPGLDDETRTLYEAPDGTLWAGTWYRGALRLEPQESAQADDDIWQRMSTPQRFGIVEEAEDYSLTYLNPIDGELRFGSRRGLFRFDADRGGLVTDQRFAKLFPNAPRRIFPFYQDPLGRVWMYTVDSRRNLQQTVVAQPTENGYKRDDASAAALLGVTVQSVYGEADGVVWLGADNALYRLDTQSATDQAQKHNTLIRGVFERESGKTLYGGDAPLPSLELEYSDNTLRFEYAAPAFNRVDGNRYRVMLEGLDRGWSDWSEEAFRDYTHIREGSYRFRAQARDIHGITGQVAVVDLRILPPWYRSIWAYAFYALVAGFLIIGLFRWRLGALRRHNRLLEAQVAERTEELSEANRALAEQSLTDPLTGLRNRRYLGQQLPSDVAMASRHYRDQHYSNADLLFFMLDLDHFKEINDHHGHAAGDQVLQQLSKILLDETRESDTVVRWGGEEFLIVARFSDATFAADMAERLRSAVADHNFLLDDRDEALRLTCSVGFAQYPLFRQSPEGVGWEKVVDVADLCLYAAKRSWRDSWVGVCSGEVPPPDEYLHQVSSHLQDLIQRGSLILLTARPDDPEGLTWQ